MYRAGKYADKCQAGLRLPTPPLGSTSMHRRPSVCRGFPPESFDAILLDGPCSGLGLRPRLVHRIPLHELAQVLGG